MLKTSTGATRSDRGKSYRIKKSRRDLWPGNLLGERAGCYGASTRRMFAPTRASFSSMRSYPRSMWYAR